MAINRYRMNVNIPELDAILEKMRERASEGDTHAQQALLLWRIFEDIGEILCPGCGEYTDTPHSLALREIEDRWFAFMLCPGCSLEMNVAAENNFNADICDAINGFLEGVEYAGTPDFLYLFKDQEKSNARRFLT